MSRKLVRPSLGLLLALTLGACSLTGGSHERRDTQAPSGPPATAENVGANVTHVAVGNGTVTFTVKVPGGPSGCAGRPQAQVIAYDAQLVTLNTVVPTSLARACHGYVTKTFTTPLDLQGRDLRVNGIRYHVGASGAAEVCNGDISCHKPQNRCDPEWTLHVIPHFDLPPAKTTKVVSCHPHWLILDVTATSASGAVQYVRWFAELDPQRRWQVVASSRTGGCVDVRLAVPSFPIAYCRGLKPPGEQAATQDTAQNTAQPSAATSSCVLRWARSDTQRDDLPTADQVRVVSCSRRWLVADVGSLTGEVRWFARPDDAGRWAIVATSTRGGCADVRRAAPDFPRATCRGLGSPVTPATS